MPVFVYQALDENGRTHEDEIVAESSAAARELLRDKGLYPVEVRDHQLGRRVSFSPAALLRGERLPLAELASVTRQLATLLNARMQLVRAFSVLIRQSRTEFGCRLFSRIREDLNEGAALAQALEKHPRIFSVLYVSMVRAGEAAGSLGPVLTRLADYLVLQQDLRRRLTGALAYPALMALTGFLVLFFMLTFVVPSVVEIFQQANQDLPWPTRFLIGGSGFLTANMELLLIGAVLLGAGGVLWVRADSGRWFFDSMKMRLPLVGDLIHKRAVARFGRTLGVLLKAGLPIMEALAVAKLVIGNVRLESTVERAREQTRKGESLSGTLERSGLFPAMFSDMVGVGEQTGRLDDMLVQVSEHFEKETESSIQTMLSLVDPAIILVMGVAVGFIVLAILLPLFEISNLVR